MAGGRDEVSRDIEVGSTDSATMASTKEYPAPTVPKDQPSESNNSKDAEDGLRRLSSESLTPAVLALDWDGPTDPDNPRNWPKGQRIFQTVAPATFGFMITFASPIYSAAVGQVERRFDVSFVVAILALSTQTLGFALGPLLAAPISETFGRRTVYLVSFPTFLLFTLGSGLAQNIQTLIICRFFAGAFGSPPLAVGAGTVADVWEVEKDGGWAAALFIMAPFAGSSLGPVIGGLVSHNATWRWTLWTVLIAGGAIALQLPFLKETYKPTLLKRRAIKRGIELPAAPGGKDALKKVIVITLLRPLHMLVTEPIVGYLSFYNAFAFGVLFAFFAAIPYSFQRSYGWDIRRGDAVFTASFTGVILGTMTFVIIDRTIYKRLHSEATKKGEKVPPEMRLIGGMIGSLGLPICLFWFAWTCKVSGHWAVPTVSILFFGWGIVLIFLSSVTYMVDVYRALAAASALAANGLLRYSFGAAFPLFTIQMYEHLGIGWATSLLGFVSAALIAVPLVLYRWGRVVRNRSSYDTLKH